MATNDSAFLEIPRRRRISEYSDASLTPGEAIEAALVMLEEDEDKETTSGSDGEGEDDVGNERYYFDASGSGSTVNSSNWKKPKWKPFQPWLLVSSVVYVATAALGGAAVFTDSWGRLYDLHVGLFSVCNATTRACVWNDMLECTENVTECLNSEFS
jgi:hypothetical protein